MSQLAEKRPSAAAAKSASFNWEDPLDLEGELTSEERMVRDSARDFMQDKLFPGVIDAYREEKFDRKTLAEMGALGLLGPTIPEEYGGAGLGYVGYGLIAREIERVEFRLSLGRVRAVLAGDASDLRVRDRSAAAQISAQACERRTSRLLRSDRA